MSDLSLDFDAQLLGTPAYADLKIVDGDLQLTSDANPQGTDSVIQFTMQRLRLFLGEWFMNTQDGVPWYQQILVKNADKATVDGLLRDCILATPGVTALLSFQSTQDRSKRIMTVSFTILTAMGKRLSSSVPVSIQGGT